MRGRAGQGIEAAEEIELRRKLNQNSRERERERETVDCKIKGAILVMGFILGTI